MVKSGSTKTSRGLLPNLAMPVEDEDEVGNPVLEVEARKDVLIRDETAKFERAMGVLWKRNDDTK